MDEAVRAIILARFERTELAYTIGKSFAEEDYPEYVEEVIKMVGHILDDIKDMQ